jgi:4,5-dihydroxyphthalate decarboxylase
MTVELTLACTGYDWTRPLWDGTVDPDGIDLRVVDYHNPERFARMVEDEEFDACELSLGSYLASRSRETPASFTAIPVFPYRKFRHSFIYRRAGDDVTLADLEGADVGLINWQTTTAIWQRGIAADRYGVDLETVTWHTLKPEGNIVPMAIPDRFDVVEDYRPGGTTDAFVSMLEAGEIDVAFSTSPLSTRVIGGRHDDPDGTESPATDTVERVFEDPMAVEADYYRETGIFPPMHVIVIDDDVLERNPWVAGTLYDGFEAALEVCMDRLTKPRWFPLAWANQHVEHQREVLGESPWEYGLTEDNRTAMEALQRYAADHGIIRSPYAPDELFVESTLS